MDHGSRHVGRRCRAGGGGRRSGQPATRGRRRRALHRHHPGSDLPGTYRAHGWHKTGDGCYVRTLSASDDVARIHENFRRHLTEMVRQSARLRPVPWEVALDEFLTRVDGTDLDWWLYGSAALAARGLPVVPGDLDFAVDDAHHAGRIFHDLLVEPVTGPLDWVARWIGRAFHLALFEWSAQAAPAVETAPNEFGRWAADRLETITWRGRPLRVPRLDVQLAVARQRGLTERADLIRDAM